LSHSEIKWDNFGKNKSEINALFLRWRSLAEGVGAHRKAEKTGQFDLAAQQLLPPLATTIKPPDQKEQVAEGMVAPKTCRAV
jgi:hypothetical protein